MQYQIIPLFSSPLAVLEVTEDFTELQKIKTDYQFDPTGSSVCNASASQDCFITKDLHILENFPKEKDILLTHFNNYKNRVLRLEDQEFSITTSWATKTEPGGFSQFHNHLNCVYSAVFYFDEIYGGDIVFEAYGIHPQQILLTNPTEWNVFNSRSWEVKTSKNILLFFPSYLYHKIAKNTSSKTRYSLAFNLFPVGQFGNQDSSICITL